MTAEIVELPVVSTLDLQPDRILAAAQKANLDTVIVVGYDQDGNEYFASSVSDGGTCLWMLERAKLALLRVGEDQYD